MTRALGVVLALLALLAFAGPAAAQGPNDSSRELRRAVTAAGILKHLSALDGIARSTNGNRLAGTPGHDESARYVAQRARAAGLQVSFQTFTYDLFALADWQPPVIDVVGGRSFVPGIAGSIQGGDFGSMVESPSGDITAPVWAADLRLPSPAPNTSTSGCEPADFEGMPRGAIVLIQRGTCIVQSKWVNAEAAGAGAVVYFNEGNPGRTTPQWGFASGIPGFTRTPIVAAQVATGAALANGVAHGLTGLTARFRVDWRPGIYPTRNVIAETRGGDPDKVVVVGAHLDSVGAGPGINDNGSGSAAILEIAEQLRGVTPRNKIRFIWFSAEETALDGSVAYVEGLSDAERARIAAMLNFDMIGSPNFGRFVYDGNASDTPRPPGGAPPYSAEIEELFVEYFAGQDLAIRPTPLDGRSDYAPFIAAGIPAGGLFTGARELKTAEETRLFGGEPGRPFDACYHLGCDDLANVSRLALEQMSDAAAHATIRLGQSRRLPARTAAAPGRRAAQPVARSAKRSRSSRLRILPLGFFGSESTTTVNFGAL